MQSVAKDLEAIITRHLPALKTLDESVLANKPSPMKWSRKEVIGHLIDSAQSNIRRFVVTQYDENPLIVYKQDQWVAICNYQQWDSNDLIELWYLLNRQICEILKNTSAETAQRQCGSPELHSIKWLAEDYVKHLLHHLHQVIELEPVSYP